MNKYSAKVDFPLFPNEQQTGNQPHYRGRIEMTKALLKEMVEIVKAGETPVLQVACWENKAKSGKMYLSSKMSVDEWAMNNPKGGGSGRQRQEEEEGEATEETEGGLFD